MSKGNVMDRMEVQLPDEVLKNLLEPGKLFKQDITPKNDDDSGSKLQKRPHTSIFLEKMAGDIVKIYVNVYQEVDREVNKSECTSSKNEKAELENTAMQTDVKPMGASVTQTDKTGTEENAIQTDKKEEKSKHQQTEKNVGQSKQQQTERNRGKNQHQQTEKKEEKHQIQQTLKTEYKECHSQTYVKEFCNTESQTASTPIVEQVCQTESAELIASISQTDMSMATQEDNSCQSDISMAFQVEGSCQASVKTHHMKCQTEVSTNEQEIQATVNSTSTPSQASVAVKVKGSQTISNNKTVLAQTDLSMLNQTDGECQVGVEISTQDCQTDVSQAFMDESGVQASVENSEVSQQTDVLPQTARIVQTDYLGVYAETQTTPDLINRECQTDDVVISLPPEENTEVENINQETVIENLQEAPALVPEGDLVQTEDIGKLEPEMPQSIIETGTQTDPVTIIIGDASFLVQKLKGSTPQTGKATGSEIEIDIGMRSKLTQNGGTMSSHQGTPQSTYRQSKTSHSTPRPVPIYSPDSNTPIQSISARKGTPKRQQRVSHVIGSRQPYAQQQGKGSLSCPFCDMTFQESPYLYEHITNSHNEAAAQRHKKPKGREGKTIVPKPQGLVQVNRGMVNPPYLVPQPVPPKPVVVSDHRMMPEVEEEEVIEEHVHDGDGPPVLEPVYSFPEVPSQSHAKKRKTYVRQPQTAMQEPGLFEDLPNPARSYPRNRVRRDEMYEEEEETVALPQMDAYEYECPHCPEKYGSASHLYTHLKRSHRDDMEKNRPLEASNVSEEQELGGQEEQHLEEQAELQPESEAPEEAVPQEENSTGEVYLEENVETEEQHQLVPESESNAPTPRKRKRVSTVAAVVKKPKKHVQEVETAEEGVIESEETSQDDEETGQPDEEDAQEDQSVQLPDIQSPKRLKSLKAQEEATSSGTKKVNSPQSRLTRKKVKVNMPQPESEDVKPTRQSKRSKRT